MNPHACFNSLRGMLTALVLAVSWHVPSVRAELTFEASWQPPSYEQVRKEMLQWIDEATLEPETAFAARAMWPVGNLRAGDGTALLERAMETFTLVDPRAQELFEACNSQFQSFQLPQTEWLEDTSLSPLLRNNARLYFGRWLAQHQLYDEVLATLAGLQTEDVVDPAGLLFYQMVAHHQVVEPDLSRLVLTQLREQEDQLPRRYRQVAELLERDLAGLKDESLDHIARRMNDVRRRLDMGRAGKQVQVVERGVVDSLDRIIKKLEQQQQQQQQSSKSGGAQQSSKPMQDSQLPSMRSPMKVDQRDIGNQSGWGDLPAKEREQALQQVGREFPTHYRELIEQYFRELADETRGSP